MNFNLIHRDGGNNIVFNGACSLSYLAFCKHLAFSGIRLPIAANLNLASRFIGELISSYQYWGNAPHSFSMPAPFANDPTEKAYVSNKIGRAFSDYLSKQLYGAHFTHCYEDVMHLNGHPINGERPDFYCDNLIQQFAVEAKGYQCKTVSDNKMQDVKLQSQQGPLMVNFSIASVAFDLYHAPNVKFYDPVVADIPYNNELNSQLRDCYFNRILELIDLLNLIPSDLPPRYENFIEYELAIGGGTITKILLHQTIVERDWNGNEWLDGLGCIDEDCYIDQDGIGIASY